MTLIERLSEFSVGVKLENIPRETRLPQGEKILRYVREKNNPPEVGIVGSRLRAPLEEAILVNGFFAHVSELEDDQYPGPTSDITIFPVVYPLAEKLRLRG
jgi:2-methylcitrate dehydratase